MGNTCHRQLGSTNLFDFVAIESVPAQGSNKGDMQWMIFATPSGNLVFESRSLNARWIQMIMQNDGNFVSYCLGSVNINDYQSNPKGSLWFGDPTGDLCGPSTGSQCATDSDCSNRTTYAEHCAAPWCSSKDTTRGYSNNWLQIGSWTIFPELAVGQPQGDPCKTNDDCTKTQGLACLNNMCVLPIYSLSFVTSQGKFAKYTMQDDGNFLTYCPCPYTGTCDNPYSVSTSVSGFNQVQVQNPDAPDQNPHMSANGCSFPCTSQQSQNINIECKTNSDCPAVLLNSLCAGTQCVKGDPGAGFPYKNPCVVQLPGITIYEDSNYNLIFMLTKSNTAYVMLSGVTGAIGCTTGSCSASVLTLPCLQGASNGSGAIDFQMYSGGNQSSLTFNPQANARLWCPGTYYVNPNTGYQSFNSGQLLPGKSF